MSPLPTRAHGLGPAGAVPCPGLPRAGHSWAGLMFWVIFLARSLQSSARRDRTEGDAGLDLDPAMPGNSSGFLGHVLGTVPQVPCQLCPHQRVPCGCGEQLGLPLLPAEVCCQRAVGSLLSVPAGCDFNELTPGLPPVCLPPWECFAAALGCFLGLFLLWGCCAALTVQWAGSGAAVGVPGSGMCLLTGSVPHLCSCLVTLSLYEVSVPVLGVAVPVLDGAAPGSAREMKVKLLPSVCLTPFDTNRLGRVLRELLGIAHLAAVSLFLHPAAHGPASAHLVPLAGWAEAGGAQAAVPCRALLSPCRDKALGCAEHHPSLGLLCHLLPSGVTGPPAPGVWCWGEGIQNLFSSFLLFWSLRKAGPAQTFSAPWCPGLGLAFPGAAPGCAGANLSAQSCARAQAGEPWALQAPAWRRRSPVLAGGCRASTQHLPGLL